MDNDLALKIYIKARATPKVVAAFAERREFDKILIYSKQVKDSFFFFAFLNYTSLLLQRFLIISVIFFLLNTSYYSCSYYVIFDQLWVLIPFVFSFVALGWLCS